MHTMKQRLVVVRLPSGKTQIMRPQLAADIFVERGRIRPDAIRRDENDYPTERIR